MLKKSRRLALPLTLVFLAQTIVSVPVFAAEPPVVKIAAPVKAQISLEQAISIVKQNFEVPKEFTQFSSGYNGYNNRQSWSLNWTNPGQDGGNFSAQVDVNSGEILSMNVWRNIPQPQTSFQIPKVSYSEAQNIAQKLVNQLLAKRLGELQRVKDDSPVIPLNNYGPVPYTFKWMRVENGIPFPSNFVNIQVNSADGQVMGYNLNWSEGTFPLAQGVVGEAKARQAFSEHKLLELQYYLPPIIRPLAANTKAQSRLIYQLNAAMGNGSIDAITGEPLKLDNGQWLAGEDALYDQGGYGGAAKSSGEAPLTPEEQSEVDKNAKMISQEQAVEAAKKWINIPESLALRNANLGMDYSYNRNRIWTLDWSSDQPVKEGPQYAYARVDAVTGELIAFSTSSQPAAGQDKPKPIDRAAAQQIVEEFLKKIQPQHFQEVKLLDEQNIPYKGYDDPVMQNFNYQRVVNGVLFPNNGITVMIDASSKTVTSYNLNWWDLNFQAPSEAMVQSNAEETFLKARPLVLKYVQTYQNGGLGAIRLVYQPSQDNVLARSNVMDAKTGQFLDWQGKALAELPRPYHFNDIAGNFAEKEISLMGQAGIFGENNEQFRPNDPITVSAMLKAMIIAKNGAWENINLKEEDVLKTAKDLGWLKEDAAPAAGVNRELMAKLMVRLLNLENIAQIPGLFQTPYEDVKMESGGSAGYIALVKGLGLMKIDGNNYDANKVMTRAEGAYTLVKTLEVKR